MPIYDGTDLVQHLFLRCKQNQILDALEDYNARLLYKQNCHHCRNRRIDIWCQEMKFRVKQQHLYHKSNRHTQTAHDIQLPHIELCFDRLRLVFLTVMVQYEIHHSTSDADKELKHCDLPSIYLMSAMHKQLYILHQQITSECQQDTVLHEQKQRFYLRIAIWMLLRNRLIQKRNQHKKRSDHNKICRIKQTVRKQRMRMRDPRHNSFRYNK